MKRKFGVVEGGLSVAVLLWASSALAQEAAGGAVVAGSVYKSIGLAASSAFAIAMSVLGASYAVGKIGSAALGAAAEKPELLSRSLLFVALAEGLAILGFAIAMVLAQKI